MDDRVTERPICLSCPFFSAPDCRRSAPQLVVSGGAMVDGGLYVETAWPRTSATGSCGDHPLMDAWIRQWMDGQ